jgi:hypothetical protein
MKSKANRMIHKVAAQVGWACPECGKVNAPDIKTCDHKATLVISLPGFVTIATTVICNDNSRRN